MFTKKANFVHKICNICRQPFRTKQTAGDEAPAACLKKSHRVHGSQAATQLKSVFFGGVYVAKNTLRGAEREFFHAKGLALLHVIVRPSPADG